MAEKTPEAQKQGDGSKAIVALVLGIAGFFIFPPIGIAALVMGGREKKAIEAGHSSPDNLTIATIAWILGIIDTVLSVMILITIIAIAILIPVIISAN